MDINLQLRSKNGSKKLLSQIVQNIYNKNPKKNRSIYAEEILNKPVTLDSLSIIPGTFTRKVRVGRGQGSGGRFCGRGNGGQKSLSGFNLPRIFEGGATPFHLTVPQYYGPTEEELERGPEPNPEVVRVSLDRIQLLIDTQRIDSTKPIDLYALKKAGISINSTKHGAGVRITCKSSIPQLTTPNIKIIATSFDRLAIQQIEESGGKVISFFYDPVLTLRSVLRPLSFSLTPIRFTLALTEGLDREEARKLANSPDIPIILPPMAAPTEEQDKLFYFSWKQRGYLNPTVWNEIIQKDEDLKKFFERAVFLPPREGILEKIEKLEEEEERKRKAIFQTYGRVIDPDGKRLHPSEIARYWFI